MNTQKINIPPNWQQVKLEDICDKISDGLHSTPKYVKKSIFYFINGNNLVNDSIIIKNQTRCVDQNEYLKHKKDLNNSTILLSINGTIGNLAYFRGEKVILGKSAAYINCSKAVKKEYIFNLLKTPKVKNLFESELTGSTIKNLGLKSIKNLKISLPPLPEQHRIVSILETWDNAIEKLSNKIKLKKQLKKGLMQKLLTGDMRLPGFSGEWKTAKLGDVAGMSSGGTPKSTVNEYYGGSIPWVSISDMTSSGKYLIETSRHLSVMGLKNSSAKIFPENTILYAMYASIGECNIAGVPVSSSQAILGIIPKDKKLNHLYLYFFLKNLQERIVLQGQQGTQSNLNKKMVQSIILELPSAEEQLAVVTVLISVDNEILLLQQKLDEFKKQKQYLLNKLVTGEIRTPESINVK